MVPQSNADANLTRIDQLANYMERDIHQRGLRPGEPYLTAADAGAMLGVSRMTANRALNLLAGRKLLVRHRSRGTFVGPGLAPRESTNANSVHYITFVDDNPTYQMPIGRMLTGLRSSLANVSLSTHIMSLNLSPQQFRREIDQLYSANSLGIIVALGTRDIQQAAADSQVPTVIHGSVYPGIDLPSLDVDQIQTGSLLAKQAIALGHRRLVFVAREDWRHGDNLALDGIQQAVAAAGLGNGSVMVRNVSTDRVALRAGVEEILHDVPRPAAFLCRLSSFACTIRDVATSMKLSIPNEIGIVYDYTSEEGDPPLPFPCVRSQLDVQEQMATVAKMLKSVASAERPNPFRAMVPTRFDHDRH